MDISAVRDVAVGISLYQPYRIVEAVELVRGAGGDEPTVAGLLEGVEVPVGILDVRTVDLVPLHVAGGIRLHEPSSLSVDGVLEVVAGERVSSVGRLLYVYDVEVANVAGGKNGPGKLCVPGRIELQQKDTAGIGGGSLCADCPTDDSSA